MPLALTSLAAPAAWGDPVVPEPVAADDDEQGVVATFIGFRQLGSGRTLVYVELSKEVEPTLAARGKTLEYTFQGTRVTLRNNRRPLLARHFESVVHSAQLVPQGKDLKLVLQLRQETSPQSRIVRHARGATFEVELAAPQPPAQ